MTIKTKLICMALAVICLGVGCVAKGADHWVAYPLFAGWFFGILTPMYGVGARPEAW